MNYYELAFSLNPNSEVNRDILSAILAEIGFESFTENQEGINGYITEHLFDEKQLLKTLSDFPLEGVVIQYNKELIKGKDWNEEWEKNYFNPIIIDDQCIIHSSFHKDLPEVKYDIVIDPKMAFGTGHHETTSLMLSFLLEMDLFDKSFLDMGCGTAVLAILSKMKGAGKVVAIDNDEWACNNSVDNVHLNNVSGITILLGDAGLLNKNEKGYAVYDIIFANINRNILLEDIPVYSTCMKEGSQLFVSGFYKEDIPYILKVCEENGLFFGTIKEKNNWVAVQCFKR